ncbi:hypothetical protein Q1695_014056 [Nippostrongylus brasiliensis]|nr:hypothetical protein Q1695_014056 [Nippostrongylus brasiliensis]
MSESPLKKKAKPDTPKAANSLQSKQQENARKEKMDLSDLLPNDIDVQRCVVQDDECTAAGNELADEEARSAMRKEILEDMMETATVHDIPLKDLTPENVEIDDNQVYSRRTMNRIRVSNPTRIPRDVFETLQRFRLAARKFAERDLEADKMDHFRCEVYRHRTKREKMRAKIAEAAVEMICFEDFFVKLKDFDEQDFKKKVGELDTDRFVYSFDDANNFNGGYKPYMVCASCESTGHWTDVCPLMKISTVEAISHEKADYEWSELAEIVWRSFENSRITSERVDAVGEFVEKMRSHLEQSLNAAIRLNIFGSLNSGFGVAKSDVDICFRFESVDQPEDVDGVQQIADCLQQMEGVEKVYAITGAKVPIVKFVCPGLGIDGDISYYNVLALSNTELLKTYCAWDKRVAPLGVWIKRWAKMCDIGDASRGSLSSYAYIILLLHYLQNCDPPLVPRLQEDFRSADTQPEIIENCDVYFHKDVIEGWSKNKRTLGELFIGFLDYYARFDFGTQVVQMRRKKPLLKTEKEWNRSLCIEDPFDLRHNLGAGITKKMFVFIVRNIHNSRKRFMLSECRKTFLEGHSLPLEKQMPQSLYDDYATLVLQDCQMGSAPSDRQCRICHCIGHFADSCQKAAQQTPRREGEKLNRRVAVPPLPKQDMTLEELRKYDGVQDEHILFALNGTIYDVTRGSSFYDPSGPYGALAGRDATRALSTMNVKNLRDEWDDLEGLTADEKETAKEWEASFKYKYPTVGRLIKEDEVHVDYGGALSSTQA